MSVTSTPNGSNNEPSFYDYLPTAENMAKLFVSPVAAGAAVVPAMGDLIKKSADQTERPHPKMTNVEVLKEGVKTSPVVGVIVGVQTELQKKTKKVLFGDSTEPSFTKEFVSSGVVGLLSAPALAVFNGRTMGLKALQSLRQLTAKQAGAIAGQESFFVAGVSSADPLATEMRNLVGSNKKENDPEEDDEFFAGKPAKFFVDKGVDYAAAYASGWAGSAAGHPFNTALTRWQNKMKVTRTRQLWLGTMRKAHGIGKFAVAFKGGTDLLNYGVQRYQARHKRQAQK